jgi:hypothetical protein
MRPGMKIKMKRDPGGRFIMKSVWIELSWWKSVVWASAA